MLERRWFGGVRDVQLSGGPKVEVSYANGPTNELSATLVVDADGRASAVRRQAGITLARQEPVNYIAGLLLDGLDGVPDDFDVMASEGDLFFVMFHQGGGRARAYLAGGLSNQRRYAGHEGTQRFLADTNFSCYPWSDRNRRRDPGRPVRHLSG
ncbi:MAG: hypothetical protein NVS3B12_29430 [Acidimicrobiales bacterium]